MLYAEFKANPAGIQGAIAPLSKEGLYVAASVLQVASADVVDVPTMDLTADEEAVVSGKSDNVSITELDVDSSTVVVVSSDDEMDSGDGDVLITGAAVEKMVSVSLVRSGGQWLMVWAWRSARRASRAR